MTKALMLPMGEQDWEDGSRYGFMCAVLPDLQDIGVTFGVELKGAEMTLEPGNWVDRCCQAVTDEDGIVTWHPPAGTAKDLGDSVDPPENMVRQVEQAKILHNEFSFQALIWHLRPAVSVEPPADADWERYNSPIGAAEMLTHIKRQIVPLRELNEISGGIVSLENVDNCQFRGGGYRVPTYLALQTGSWLDAVWIKKQAGVMFTLDSEHFYGARNLLMRMEDLAALPRWEPEEVTTRFGIGFGQGEPTAMAELASITGYFLMQGYPPITRLELNLAKFLNLNQPRILHLGASHRAVMEDGTIGTHLPFNIYNDEQMADLDLLLEYFLTHDDCFSAVIEVTGQLDSEKYSRWSPRPENDELAKWDSSRMVVDRIGIVRKRLGLTA